MSGIGLYTWQVEPFWLDFEFVEMHITGLPLHLRGKTLMQISDMHVSDRFPVRFLLKSLTRAGKFKPDFVVYTGDYITYESDKQLSDLKKVADYLVKGKIATAAIMGNHDYGPEWLDKRISDDIQDILEQANVDVLRNEMKNYEGLNIFGLDDYWGPNFNPKPILTKVNPLHSNLVLSHNPDTVDLDIWNNFEGWILSGHTHGGQCKPPFLKPPLLPVYNKRYVSGYYELEGNRQLYINRALGHLIQIRCNVRPEITIFTLT